MIFALCFCNRGFMPGDLIFADENGALNAIIAETDEYSYLKFGHRIIGTIYSCSSVGIKIETGLSTALCRFILD